MSLRKIIATGVMAAALSLFAPLCIQAQVPEAQMDGVMGQSLKEENVISSYPLPTLKGASSFSQSFIENSFTTEGDYTNETYYHKVDYEDRTLYNGIDVSWWQAGGKGSTTTKIDWEKAHNAGIDFTFVRVASRDTTDGSIFEDTAADSHIQGALDNDINVGLYIFSQALTEDEAVEEADYVLELLDQYDWDITLPIAMDREPGHNKRMTAGMLSKEEETAVEQAFIDTITDAGYQAAIYSNYNWFRNYINGEDLENCQIWFARYNYTTTSNTKSGEAYADVPVDYDFWQYTSTDVKLDGWPSSSLDLNFWYKDTSAKTMELEAKVSTDSSIELTWGEAAEDVSGYRVYRYDPEQDKYVALKSTTQRSFTDSDLESGTSYQYKVRCYWTIGGTNTYGTFSDVLDASTLPGQVSGITTEKKSSTYITLSWDEVNGASGYRIYQYSKETEKFEKLTDITADVSSFKVSDLSTAKEYIFKVRAYTSTPSGNVWGSVSEEYADATKPSKVSSVTASSSSGKINLSWKPVSRASGYQIYRLNTKTGKFEKIATVKGSKTTSYQNVKLKKGKTYTYKVRAYFTYEDSNNYGAFSSEVKKKVK